MRHKKVSSFEAMDFNTLTTYIPKSIAEELCSIVQRREEIHYSKTRCRQKERLERVNVCFR